MEISTKGDQHPQRHRGFLPTLHHRKRLKKRNHVDAVHLHSSKSGFLGRLACKLARIKTVVYTPNGAPFLVGSNRLINYIYKQLERLGSVFGGQVVCCSPSECEAYQALGIDALNINNGVSIGVPTHVQGKSVRPVSHGKFRIVTSGRIVDQKKSCPFQRGGRIFRGVRRVLHSYGVGDGGARGLDDGYKNIVVTGWLTSRETKELIANSQVYMSTAHFEGLPFAVLEALILKKPVLLSDCIGNRDIVHKGLANERPVPQRRRGHP